MLSVTQRIKSISQPRGGYVPRDLFHEEHYQDYYEIKEVEPAFTSIQGTAIDYLTRYLISHDKLSAFSVPIIGAKRVDEVSGNNAEYRKIMSLLERVTGLDDTSIYNACKITGYDTSLRSGVRTFSDVEQINPTNDVIQNIRIMTERSLTFIKRIGPIVCDGFTFEGGYTELVSSGDGDYLTKETLVDLKASKSKFSPSWSLQLLIYYLLGIHSIHPEFQSIEKLCIFNPVENTSSVCNVDDISDEIKYKVSHEVIGYKMRFPYFSKWENVDGTDPFVLESYFKTRQHSYFSPEDYEDGIHEISTNDYWSYLCRLDSQSNGFRPTFKHTEKVLMIKRSRYYMFLSRSPKGTLCVLNGGKRRKASFSVEYYFDNIERYANAVLNRFHRYWETLYAISERLKALTPDKESLRKTLYVEYIKNKSIGDAYLKFDEWYELYVISNGTQLSGRVHGCIVDIDFSNHIFLNPFDGTLVPYSAVSMSDKNIYKNTISLISAKRPEMLKSLSQSCLSENEATSFLVPSNDVTQSLVSRSDVISSDFVKEYSLDMYAISNRLFPLQSVYDKGIIKVWYDSILQEDKTKLESKYLLSSVAPKKKTDPAEKYIGKERNQKGNHSATITAYRTKNDIDVVFEDGSIRQHIRFEQWRKGLILHSSIRRNACSNQQRAKSIQLTARKNYIGMTKRMNCGLNATVIEYINGKDITVRFEDGLIREHVRPDKFKAGTIAHKTHQ